MEETKKVLTEWNLDELIEVFVANEITYEMFYDLTESLIKELIPKIGTRIKFTNKLQILKADVVDAASFFGNQLSDIEGSAFSPEGTSSTITNASSHSISSSNDQDFKEIITVPPAVPFHEDDAQLNNGRTTTTKISNLKDLLKSTNSGKSILEVYEKSTFQRTHRQQLVDIIITNELEGQPDKRLSSARLSELANMVVELFPSEYKETYFVKVTTLKNGKPHNIGKGKLFSKYYSLRRAFMNTGLLKNSRKSLAADDVPGPSNTNGDEQEETLLWLKNCVEPWTSVETNWNKTFGIRQSRQTQPEKLCEYFSKFPCLRTSKGYLLLELDFKNIYPDYEMKLFYSWETVSRRIIEHAEIVCKDPVPKELLAKIERNVSTSDSVVSNLMVLLTYLLPTISIRKAKQTGRWRPSRVEVAEGFWLHLKAISELKQSVESRKNKLQRLGLTLQPMVIVIGPSLTELETIYVRIDDNLYRIESCLKALDVCFKSFHALHAEYAAEAEQIWYFIQKAFYNLTTKWDKSFIGVNSLLSDLKLK